MEEEWQYLDQTPRTKRDQALYETPDKSFVVELSASEALCACAVKMANECLVVGWVR